MTPAVPFVHLAPPATRLQKMRDATRIAHAQIEGSLPLLDPRLTRARYCGVLEAFHGFYVDLEPQLAAMAGPHAADLELVRRAKVPLLSSDLGALGKTPAEIARLLRCTDLPLIATRSHAFGVLYVLEGATLGGQVIGRSLKASLGLLPANGAAFFDGYGTETRALWNRFCAHVNQAPGLDDASLVASAVGTFEKLRLWLVAAKC